MGEVPDALPVTEETRERLREQANQLGEATTIRLIDLLHVAVEDMRQGGDPRLPLELALVKTTHAAADLSQQSLAYRVAQLEEGHPPVQRARPTEPEAEAPAEPEPQPETKSEPPAVELTQLQEAWGRSIIPAVEQRGGIPTAAVLAKARPSGLDGDTLTVEFPAAASFQAKLAEEPRNTTVLRDALYEVTGRKLAVAFAVGEGTHEEPGDEGPVSEDELFELMKETFDAREVEDTP
jgi:DNA polymerase III gamma/tau subunit